MEATALNITMDSIPSMSSMLLRAATSRKPTPANIQFSPITITAHGIRADLHKLAKFETVCGFQAGDTLPLTYPHIMAFALHMQLMLAPQFPFTPMGAVHVRNRIRQVRPIHKNESIDFEVRLGDCMQVAKGYEIAIITEARVAGELIWDDLSIMLIRKGGSGDSHDKNKDNNKDKNQNPSSSKQALDYEHSVQWHLAANHGRRYAAASGDYNPIHLYPLSAKLMGFKRQIMHGMWSKSRAVAQLLAEESSSHVAVDVAFKLPIFLPSTVTLLYTHSGTGSLFELRDASGDKPHLAGNIEQGISLG